MNKYIDAIAPEHMQALTQYHWPGNIRELQNLIERSVILSSGKILNVGLTELRDSLSAFQPKARTLAQAERAHILQALHETEWVIGGPRGASALLGVKRTTLLDKMRRLGISRPEA
jgi:formate hydrogenlyase transcriptional activator